MTRMLKPFLGLAALATLARAAPAPLFGINLGSGDESSDSVGELHCELLDEGDRKRLVRETRQERATGENERRGLEADGTVNGLV